MCDGEFILCRGKIELQLYVQTIITLHMPKIIYGPEYIGRLYVWVFTWKSLEVNGYKNPGKLTSILHVNHDLILVDVMWETADQIRTISYVEADEYSWAFIASGCEIGGTLPVFIYCYRKCLSGSRYSIRLLEIMGVHCKDSQFSQGFVGQSWEVLDVPQPPPPPHRTPCQCLLNHKADCQLDIPSLWNIYETCLYPGADPGIVSLERWNEGRAPAESALLTQYTPLFQNPSPRPSKIHGPPRTESKTGTSCGHIAVLGWCRIILALILEYLFAHINVWVSRLNDRN